MLITHDNNRKSDNFLQYQKKKRKEYILNGGIIMKLVPLSDRVVLKQCEAEETTKSGIILTSSGWKRSYHAGKRGTESYLFQICRNRSEIRRRRVYHRKTE